MPGLLGKKIGMTSVFSADGKNVPCTVIEAGPCVVTQIKSVEKDGYAAVQVGFQDKKEKHTTKPLMGHFKKAGVTPKRHLAEFKDFETELNLGDTITVELFNDAAYVDVVGTSKGKGFQGVVKRWGIRIQYGKAVRAGKGRHVGSIGPWTPSRTMWTVAQAGQMGYHKRTEFNKKILKIASADEVDQINPDGGFVKYGLVKNDYVLVKGSLPGPSKRLVILRQPIRPNNKSEDMPQINYISTKSKQGV